MDRGPAGKVGVDARAAGLKCRLMEASVSDGRAARSSAAAKAGTIGLPVDRSTDDPVL
jgi:hypothetical protein